MTAKQSIRILHVVGSMNRGGVETWLMHVLRHIDRHRFQMDFLVHTNQPCAYAQEIRNLGGRILPCLHPSHPVKYAWNFRRILREDGPYDVIHSHVHYYSGFVLWLAQQREPSLLIAHSHSDTSSLDKRAGFWRRMYLQCMRRLLSRYTIIGFAASRKAAVALFGAKWEQDPRLHLLYYGVDLIPFRKSIASDLIRRELGIASDVFVMGHVGSFRKVKNHEFLIDIAANVIQREPHTCLLLVGDGPLRKAVEQKIRQHGLEHQVAFTGVRSDIHEVMRAIDVLVMPSLYEGLPVVGIEAQACGLPLVLSDVVTEELDHIPALLHRVSLSRPASFWAEQVLTARKLRSENIQTEAISIIEKSPLNITYSVDQLQEVYNTLIT